MKKNYKPTALDHELLNLFRDILPEEEAIKATKDAKKAFYFIRQNHLFLEDFQ
ncbi:MAG: hypothetical protein JWP12_1603 [Bacteroidetes bacterium]|nr:hypothetical protein [Bacteroidota bacterium]